jgi:hypothetical protein
MPRSTADRSLRSELVEALDHARFAGADPLGKARFLAPAAEVLPAPGAQVAPEVAAWQAALTQRLERWRTDLAGRLAAGETPKPWAKALGPAPADPEIRARWADAVAHVALYRAAHHVEGDTLFGPDPPLGTPSSAAAMRAKRASLTAQELAGNARQANGPGSPSLSRAQSPAGPRVIPPESRPPAPKPPTLRR